MGIEVEEIISFFPSEKVETFQGHRMEEKTQFFCFVKKIIFCISSSALI
jgi:hypothetical protein